MANGLKLRPAEKRVAVHPMPHITPPNLEFRFKPVGEHVWNGIKRRLARERRWIVDAWNLGEDEAELEARLVDMTDKLEICWRFLRGADRAASVAQQRVNLRAFLKRSDFSREAFDRLDAATQATIANRHPGGEMALSMNKDPSAIKRAVRQAIEFLGPIERGRPRLSDSLARAQFCLFLARSYASATGKKPTRAWRTYRKGGYGPFREFVAKVVGMLPRKLQPPSVDGLVLLAIEEFDQSEIDRVKEPYRIWNIDRRRWLGNAQGN
jgi:hypothetical protein